MSSGVQTALNSQLAGVMTPIRCYRAGSTRTGGWSMDHTPSGLSPSGMYHVEIIPIMVHFTCITFLDQKRCDQELPNW